VSFAQCMRSNPTDYQTNQLTWTSQNQRGKWFKNPVGYISYGVNILWALIFHQLS